MTDILDKIQNALEVLNGDVKRGQAELQKDVTIIKDDLATLQKDVAGIKNDVADIRRILDKLGAVITQASPSSMQGSGPGLGQGGLGL